MCPRTGLFTLFLGSIHVVKIMNSILNNANLTDLHMTDINGIPLWNGAKLESVMYVLIEPYTKANIFKYMLILFLAFPRRIRSKVYIIPPKAPIPSFFTLIKDKRDVEIGIHQFLLLARNACTPEDFKRNFIDFAMTNRLCFQPDKRSEELILKNNYAF